MALAPFIGELFSRFRRRFFRSSTETEENAAHRLGRTGERLARRYLRRQGYKVLYQNFRAPRGGEVDLVCRDRAAGALVFVEVKTRRGRAYGDPAEAVTREKQQLIARGALAWLRLLDNPEIFFRFDIVEIVFEGDKPTYHLIKDAFKLPEPYIYQ
jgi:putative endonuclease